MKTLLLLRHAKSSWKDESRSDFDRPLNDRGKHDAPRVGEALRQRALRPSLVLASPARRARKTAEKAIAASGYDVELRLLDELYLAGPGICVQLLGKLSDELSCVMVVGHNPGLEALCADLTGRHEAMPTASVVQIELPIEHWSEIATDRSAKLIWSWQPKDEE